MSSPRNCWWLRSGAQEPFTAPRLHSVWLSRDLACHYSEHALQVLNRCGFLWGAHLREAYAIWAGPKISVGKWGEPEASQEPGWGQDELGASAVDSGKAQLVLLGS